MTGITTGERIATLDIVRGIAVMGILAINIVAFADVPSAYLNPFAQTAALRAGDLVTYAVNFLVFDGKMRGLFSFLFGASLLLLTEKMAIGVVRRRLFWLLLFGLFHFFLIWYGDILTGYALIGFLALAFRHASQRKLMVWAIIFLVVQLLIFAGVANAAFEMQQAMAQNPTRETVEAWTQMSRDIGVPTAAHRAEVVSLYLGSWTDLVAHQITEKWAMPLVMTFMFGWETIAYMLLGMAALRSGLLTGAWDNRRYAKWALVCLGIALPLYLLALRFLFRADFAVPAVFAWSFTATIPIRPLMIVAYACLIILATRRGGWLVERIAAAGQAAFTNYLGTSVLMTALFYGWGLGLFGKLGRMELAVVVAATWVVMLAWSKPWLAHYRYGPLEWAWRSLTNWRVEPLRRERLGAPAEA